MSVNFDYRINRFSQAASTYDSVSVVQKKMAKQLLFFLQKLQFELFSLKLNEKSLQGLELGCGTGHLTRLLLTSPLLQKVTQWIFSDLSKEMLKKNQDIIEKSIQLDEKRMTKWVEMSAYQIEGCFHVITSNALIQWLDLKQHFQAVYQAIYHQGFYLFSGFGKQHFQELYSLFLNKNPEKFAWQGGFSQEDIEEQVSILGFELCGWWSESYTMEYASFWSFIQQIRKFGGSGSASSSQITIKKLRNLEYHYQKNYSSSKGVKATWHPFYALIQKK